jgi:hypothetical protein
VQRIGQASDISHTRSHFGDASLRRPQSREHRTAQISALDCLLRRRAIFLVRRQYFSRPSLNGIRCGE